MQKLGSIAGMSLALWGGLLGAALTGCADDGSDGSDGAAGPAGPTGAAGSAGAAGPAGPAFALPAVYTLGNAPAGNQVSSYLRASTGSLSREGTFATTGKGLGAGLGSQDGLVFDDESQRFFAVNAGDSSISMLAIGADGELTALATVPSGGKLPVSLTVSGGTVYVVNQGDPAATPVGASITGFTVKGDALEAIPGSTQPLSSTGDVHPTDIQFTPDGGYVVVAERNLSKVDTFKIVGGVAQPGNFQASAGMQPFAFAFSPEGFLLVAEVGTGAAGASSVSSYAISDAGVLTNITPHLATLQSAACWIVMAGGHAYIANAASANITGIDVAETGALALHDSSGITAQTGTGAIDLAVSPDHGYLYSLAGGTHEIHIFEINADGSLTAQPTLSGAPQFAAGLVAR